MQHLEFLQSCADSTLHVYQNASIIINLLIYIEDIFIVGSHPHAFRQVGHNLKQVFLIKELGTLSQFMKVHATPSDKGIHLT